MKKIIFSILAVAALASCMKEQTVSVQQSGKIGFAGTFVENATRADDPSTTTANIEEFYVWGVIDNETGIVFDDERVYKSGSEWTYDETQYWTPAHKYYFSALAGDRTNNQIVIDLAAAADNGMSVDGLGTVTFTNVDGTNDVLYSESERETGAAITSQPEDVKFQFAHLLSKVKFSFKNGFVNQNNSIVVKNIKMTVPQTGVIDLTQDSFVWYDLAGDLVLEMGNMDEAAKVLAGATASSDNERLTIPAAATQEYTVTFDVELYQGAVLASSASKTVKIEGCALEPGKAYNFTAVINEQNVDDNPLFPITFDAEVNEWDTEVVYDGGVLADNTYVVYTRDELQDVLDAANTAGENVKAIFGADIEGNVNVYELPNLTNIIDGNNFKFNGTFNIVGKSTYGNGTTVFQNIKFETTDKSTFTGDAFIYCNEQNGNTRYPDNVTIKNCTFTATGAAEKLTVGAKFRSINGNFVVESCEAKGLHSLAQLLSCGNAVATFDNVTISDSKNGISLEKTGKTTISNSNISTSEYGVRADGCVANTSIVSSTIAANQPVIVRKVTTDGYVLNVDDATVLTTSEAYDIIFTKNSDDVAYVVPTNSFTCNAPAKHNVFPAIVNTVEDLVAALAADEEKTIVLAADLDLSQTTYTPAGTESKKWTGTLDGMGHTISGLKIDNDYAALIAYAAEGAVVKNLHLVDVNIQSAKYGAAVVCVAENNTTIENVTVSGTVSATSYAAGLVLMNNDDDDAVTIKGCTNNATVVSKRAGGVAAWVTGDSVIDGCVNNGDITGDISASGITNRIAGTIKNCVNNGAIIGKGTEASAGIAGIQTAASTFEYCFNYGNVTTTTDNPNASAAGILGQTPSKAATLNYCVNYGNITAQQSYAAGIAYSLYGNINATYCYNEGAVSGADGAGAIAPKAQYGANDTAKYCLNAGTITSSNGKVYQGSNKNTSCYYYNNGNLFNVTGNTAELETDALTVLNGGADADFFTMVNGAIVVAE